MQQPLQPAVAIDLWVSMEEKNMYRLQKLFEDHGINGNTPMYHPDPRARSSNPHKCSVLYWACDMLSSEAIAFMMCRGADPFLSFTGDVRGLSPMERTFQHYKAKDLHSAYVLALINVQDNPITSIGRNPDAPLELPWLKNKEGITALALAVTSNYPWGIRWLIQGRHASIHVAEADGSTPITYLLSEVEERYKSTLDPEDKSLRRRDVDFRYLMDMIKRILWVKSSLSTPLNLHEFSRRYPHAVHLVELNPQLVDQNSRIYFHTDKHKARAEEHRRNPQAVEQYIANLPWSWRRRPFESSYPPEGDTPDASDEETESPVKKAKGLGQ